MKKVIQYFGIQEYIGLKHALILKFEKDSGRTQKEADIQ